MPIRWSVLKVKEATDKVEEIVKPILEPLEQAKAVVIEAKKLPNLPDYMKERLSRLEGEIERVTGYKGSDWVNGKSIEVFHKGYIFRAIDAIRENLPKQDLAREQAQYEKMLAFFSGDREKASLAIEISKPKKEVPKEQLSFLGDPEVRGE